MFQLCYIEKPWAYFTTLPLDVQWGDDWNDAPYEHNAGRPYMPRERCSQDWDVDGSPLWEVIRIAFDGPFETPAEYHPSPNSPWSVEEINRGEVPWLTHENDRGICLYAGAGLTTFRQFIRNNGGEIYERRS